MKLTPQQKLEALAYRFYQGIEWEPKAGDYYTTSRADLELYQVVAVENGVIKTRYTEGTDAISEWPEAGFLTEGFGPKRVYVPSFVLARALLPDRTGEPVASIGEFSFDRTYWNDAGNEMTESITVPASTVTEIIAAALASLPGRTGEPVAAYTIDCVGTEHMSRDVAGIERIAREGSKGPTPVGYFYASPDAEQARLRERVASWLRLLWIEIPLVQDPVARNNLGYYAQELGSIFGIPAPEARLAQQAERATAVTEGKP